jgi:ABC-2 type transport system permease protein
MSNVMTVLEIAKWEFFRWFKWKDQFITLAVWLILGAAFWGGQWLIGRSAAEKIRIVALYSEGEAFRFQSDGRMEFAEPGEKTEEQLRQTVLEGELEGILIVKNLDEAELIVSKEPRWVGELENALTAQRQQMKLKQSEISSAWRLSATDLFRHFQLHVRPPEADGDTSPRIGTAEKIAAGILLGLMLMGVLFSAGSQFISITGEKQLRVTEQIIAAVTAQQWIDGKILGISAFSFVRLINIAVSMTLFLLVGKYLGTGFDIPIILVNPLLIVVLLLLNIGGFFFWNTFFAALSATINDPNTSSKTTLVFAPFIVSIGLALGATFKNPDSTLAHILSIVPPTSPAAISARLVFTEVLWWEIVACFFVLVISSWMMRKAAARVFRLGILMYGKEPTTKEIWRWMREA